MVSRFTTKLPRNTRGGYISRRRRYGMARLSKPTKKGVRAVVQDELRKNTELKYYELQAGGSGIDNNGLIYDLSPVPQGLGDSSRVGDKITPHSLKVTLQAGLADTTNMLRLVFFRWKPSSIAVAPTIAGIFSAGPGSVWAPTANYNHDQRGNFVVLYDKLFNLSAGAKPNPLIKRTIKLTTDKIDFISGSTNRLNGIYMAAISDSGAVPHPDFIATFTFYYTDS